MRRCVVAFYVDLTHYFLRFFLVVVVVENQMKKKSFYIYFLIKSRHFSSIKTSDMKNDYNDVLLTTTNLTTKNTFFWLERTKTFAICTCKIDYFVKFCFVLFVR